MQKKRFLILLLIISSLQLSAQQLKLLTEPLINRISDVVVYGQVKDINNIPDNVYLKINSEIYTVSVNDTGLFMQPYVLNQGENNISVAFTNEGLTNPIDEQKLKFIDYKLPNIFIDGNINGTTISLTAEGSSGLNFVWEEGKQNPQSLDLSSTNGKNISFEKPTLFGEYYIYCTATDSEGRSFKAGRFLKTDNQQTKLNTPDMHANWVDSIIMYEYALFRFDYADLPFERMSEKFNHIKQLGATALWHTPPILGNGGGYHPKNFYLIDPEYGINADYKQFVKKAHNAGLKVIFDIPIGHTSNNHSFLNNVYCLKNQSPYKNYYYWAGEPGNSAVTFSPDNGSDCVYTNVSNPETKEYLLKVLEYWLREYDIDGFRYDCGQEIYNRDKQFLIEAQNRLRNIKPDIALFIEGNYDENPEYLSVADICYDWRFYAWGNNGLRGVFDQNISIDEFNNDFMQAFADSTLPLRYCNVGYFPPAHNIWDMEREKTGHIIAFTGFGTPLIYSGTETGSSSEGNNAVNWKENLNVYPFYRKIIEVKKKLLGSYPKLLRLTNNASNLVYSYLSKNNNKRIIVVANLSENAISTNVNLNVEEINTLSTYHFQDLINNDDKILSQQELSSVEVNLNAWESKMFWIGESAIDFDKKVESLEIENDDLTINTHQGEIQLHYKVLPENALDKRLNWSVDNENLAKISDNGLIKATGLENGIVNVSVSALDNSGVEYTFAVNISNQLNYHNYILNPEFDDYFNYWNITHYSGLVDFNSNDFQANISIEKQSVNQWDIQISQPYINLDPNTDYVLIFDIKSSVNQNILCSLATMEEPNAILIWDGISAYDQWQNIEVDFTTPAEISSLNLSFMLGDNLGNISLDNFILKEKTAEDIVNISFCVDMKKEETPFGVGITGSWLNWTDVVILNKNNNIYSASIDLEQNAYYEYKFVKIDENANINEWEQITSGSSCEANGNRFIKTSTFNQELDSVCFSSCSRCSNSGVNEIKNDDNIFVYPNPVNDFLYLNFNKNINISQLSIFTINGCLIKTININNKNNFQINVDKLKSGIYYVSLKNKNIIYINKFVKI